MEVITSQQSKQIIILDGYRYRLDRTNADDTSSWRCIVEGWHHAFQSSVDYHHLTIYELISHFRIEQENIEQCVARFLAGELNEDANNAK